MVMHGHPTTLTATTAMHTAAVARRAPAKFIVADLPFLSYRKGLKDAMDSVQELMSAGAHAVKLEGVRGHAEIVRHIVESGVPVMGHLGLTPQSINMLGGMQVQARTDAAIEILAGEARELEDAGCSSTCARIAELPRPWTEAARLGGHGGGLSPLRCHRRSQI
jgi:3-methyl-2-oxobutanoate hydroxymethyltransferase